MSRHNLVSHLCLAVAILANAARLGAQEAAADEPIQEPAATDSLLATEASDDRVRVFLDCDICDGAFLRTEITFVDYVRDSNDADVHLLVTYQAAGGGSIEYAMQFIGMGRFAEVSDDIRYASGRDDTQDQTRRGIAQVMKGGLMRYLVRTPMAQRMELSFGPQPDDTGGGQSSNSARDPWNAWVFRTSVSASLGREASYNSLNVNVSGSASRTTAAWKTSLSFSTRMSENNTRVRDDWVTNKQKDMSLNALNVRSITDHWSIGGRSNANHSTFQNRDLALRVAPAIEFNVYPYSESTRRQLTFQYTLGANRVKYLEETIYGRFNETLFDQALGISYQTRQTWGNANLGVEGSHYLHDTGKYSVQASGFMDLRVFRGFSLTFSGSAQRIHDQLHLVKGNLTDEQILLRQRQIASAYRYSASVGVSFSFGSIFTPVVNPRLN